MSELFAVLGSTSAKEKSVGLEIPYITFAEPSWRCIYFGVKSTIDLVLASIALFLAAPIMLLIALAIMVDSPGSPIFVQNRVSSRRLKISGKSSIWVPYQFKVYKFRTMYQNADRMRHQIFIQALIERNDEKLAALQGGDTTESSRYKLTNDPRITRIGKWLRRSSLDELPQLFNILKGDMTLVGPRPAIPYEVQMYEGWHRQRLAARPGLTGLWQVKGRSSVTFDEMVKLDIEYIKKQCLWLDVKIIFKTPLAVLHGKGAV